MNLQALGYVGIRTRRLEDWNAYASRFLGLQLVDKSRTTMAFRASFLRCGEKACSRAH